jgi:hypothetical protein
MKPFIQKSVVKKAKLFCSYCNRLEPYPLLANIGSLYGYICHTEKRKTDKEVRKTAVYYLLDLRHLQPVLWIRIPRIDLAVLDPDPYWG